MKIESFVLLIIFTISFISGRSIIDSYIRESKKAITNDFNPLDYDLNIKCLHLYLYRQQPNRRKLLDKFQEYICLNLLESLQHSKRKRFFSLSKEIHGKYNDYNYSNNRLGLKVFKYGK